WSTTRRQHRRCHSVDIGQILMALSGSETLDKSSRHACLDHDASIGRDVTDAPRNPVEARHLLAVERLAAVEGNRDATSIKGHTCRPQLHQLVRAVHITTR